VVLVYSYSRINSKAKKKTQHTRTPLTGRKLIKTTKQRLSLQTADCAKHSL
jgi:hypothetical protein